MKNELKAYVDGIRDDLKNLYELNISDEEREEREENGEAYDLYSYFADVLDVEYRVDYNGALLIDCPTRFTETTAISSTSAQFV